MVRVPAVTQPGLVPQSNRIVAEYCIAWHRPLVAQQCCWHWPRVLALNCAKPKKPVKSAETREPKEHVGAVDPDGGGGGSVPAAEH